MKFGLFLLGAVWSVLGASAFAAEAAGVPVVAKKVTRIFQDPKDPTRKFEYVEVPPASRAKVSPDVMVLLPAGGMNFSFYEMGISLVKGMTANGIAVFGLSPRTQLVDPACLQNASSCAHLRGWGLSALMDDLDVVLKLAERKYPKSRIFVGGLSQGAFGAIEALRIWPKRFAGAVLWEGLLYSSDPRVVEPNRQLCQMYRDKISAETFLDTESLGGIKLMGSLAKQDPNGPTPIPGFPEGTQNQMALWLSLVSPQDPPLSYTPQYLMLAPGSEMGTFAMASWESVYEMLEGLNASESMAMQRDLACRLAGMDGVQSHEYAAFSGKLLFVREGRGIGPWMVDQMTAFSKAEKTDLSFEKVGSGHADHVASLQGQAEVLREILSWIR